jgi:Outer membrane protein beta-barrel family/Carboxypeptidase regulatory-like domain
MNIRSLPVLLFLLSVEIYAFAQKNNGNTKEKIQGSVRGIIADTAGKQDMSEATVSVTSLEADSSDAQFVTTDKNGFFQVKNLRSGNYRLLITFEGYRHIRKGFTVSGDNRDINLGLMYMQRATDLMQEVVVQRPPVTIRKDTVEYDAGSFTTKPNAVAEDLLKKMPGIQVDKNGGITAQGETVTRVLVNGKRFFSDDPKLATRNLPPDIIEKIQVFDDLSDQSKFSGFDDGNRVKTINIITKKDKRQGYFGKAVAGIGTDENYDESLNMHRFDNDEQISVLGQANDINKQNFTPDGNTGGRGGGGGGGGGAGGSAATTSNSGVTTVWAGGANYRNSFGPKTDLYGSYFFNSQHITVNQQDSTIKTIQGEPGQDSSNTTAGYQSNIQRRETQRVYLNLEQKFDSNNSLVFRPNITFQSSDPTASSYSSTVDNHGMPVNTSVGNSSSYNSGFNINGSNLQLRHKFSKKFRTLSLDINGTANVNKGYGYNYAVNNFYQPLSVDTLNQYTVDTLHSYTISPTLSYTEPVGKNQILELNYNYNYQHNVSINNTYDFVDSLHNYKTFDSLFSNSYTFISHANRFTLNYRIQNPKYNLSVGSGLQFTGFNSLNTTKDISVIHNYVNITPTVNFQYYISKTQHFRLNYAGRPGTPTVVQLQPLVTTTDQINYQEGNPALKPQFTHSLRMLYTSFDPGTQRVIFATINASTVVNDIQSAVYYNSKGGQQTTYVNLNGTYNISGYFNYGLALKKPKSNLNFITNITYAQSQTLLATDSLDAAENNYAHVYSKNTGLSETISWTTNIKKNFDMNFSSTSKYSINQRTGGPPQPSKSQNNLNAFSQSFSAEITAYTNNGWLISTNFDYTYTNNNAAAYNASVPLVSPSIAKELFKKKNGEIRLSVFDLLNQNVAVSKSVTSNQESYTRTNVLTRYTMLTFTYNLNNFADSKQKRMPGVFPGGGGGRRGEGRFDGGGNGGGGARK